MPPREQAPTPADRLLVLHARQLRLRTRASSSCAGFPPSSTTDTLCLTEAVNGKGDAVIEPAQSDARYRRTQGQVLQFVTTNPPRGRGCWRRHSPCIPAIMRPGRTRQPPGS